MKKSLGARALVYPSPVWCVGSYDVDGKPIAHRSFVLGAGTNNSAEYGALIKTLEWCVNNRVKEIVILTDSMLVVKQMAGLNRCYPRHLRKLLRRAKELEAKVGDVRLRWVDNKFVKQKLGH